jgi:hypothetical protein
VLGNDRIGAVASGPDDDVAFELLVGRQHYTTIHGGYVMCVQMNVRSAAFKRFHDTSASYLRHLRQDSIGCLFLTVTTARLAARTAAFAFHNRGIVLASSQTRCHWAFVPVITRHQPVCGMFL